MAKSIGFLLYCLLGLTGGTASAEPTENPKFGPLFACGENVVFVSPDERRLISIEQSGEKIWENSYRSPIEAFPWDDRSVLIQFERDVLIVDAATGDEKTLFKANTPHEQVHFEPRCDLLYLTDTRLSQRRFHMLAFRSAERAWENRDIDSVLLATKDWVICLSGSRELGPDGSYDLLNRAVLAYDRKFGSLKWKAAVSGDGWTLPAVYAADLVVLFDGKERLLCLRPADGEIAGSLTTVSGDKEGWVAALAARGDQVAYVTCTKKGDDLETILHWCSLPDFKETSSLAIPSNPDSGLEFHQNFLILDGKSEVTCFDLENSKKIWSKGPMNRSEVVKGKVYFSDNQGGKCRLGFLEAATGKEKILYEESGSEE